jgi:hypothetical protein
VSLSKSKCWYSNNCLHFLKRAVPLAIVASMAVAKRAAGAGALTEICQKWKSTFFESPTFMIAVIEKKERKSNKILTTTLV